MLHFLNHDSSKVVKLAQELRQVSDTKGFPAWALLGVIFEIWASMMLGIRTGGPEADTWPHIEGLQGAINALKANGSQLLLPQFLCILAEVLALQGRSDEAKGSLNEALAVADRTGDRCCEPEMHRLLGDLELSSCSRTRSADIEAAEQDYLAALDAAGVTSHEDMVVFMLNESLSHSKVIGTLEEFARGTGKAHLPRGL